MPLPLRHSGVRTLGWSISSLWGGVSLFAKLLILPGMSLMSPPHHFADRPYPNCLLQDPVCPPPGVLASPASSIQDAGGPRGRTTRLRSAGCPLASPLLCAAPCCALTGAIGHSGAQELPLGAALVTRPQALAAGRPGQLARPPARLPAHVRGVERSEALAVAVPAPASLA